MSNLADMFDNIYKRAVPANARIFMSTVAGNRSPITEKDFTDTELSTLRDLYNEKTASNRERQENYRNLQYNTPREYQLSPETRIDPIKGGRAIPVSYSDWQEDLKRKEDSYNKNPTKTSVSYEDYNVKKGYNTAPVMDGWLNTIMNSYRDPRQALMGTLGSFNFQDNGGRVEDTYGMKKDQQWYYHNAANKGLMDILQRYYDKPGSLGENLYRKYLGDAERPVNINLR